jgi:hypothetical protein
MGCTDGGPDYEQERWKRDMARGYFRGGLGQPDTCLRCGCLIANDRYWDVHDRFHADALTQEAQRIGLEY